MLMLTSASPSMSTWIQKMFEWTLTPTLMSCVDIDVHVDVNGVVKIDVKVNIDTDHNVNANVEVKAVVDNVRGDVSKVRCECFSYWHLARTRKYCVCQIRSTILIKKSYQN